MAYTLLSQLRQRCFIKECRGILAEVGGQGKRKSGFLTTFFGFTTEARSPQSRKLSISTYDSVLSVSLWPDLDGFTTEAQSPPSEPLAPLLISISVFSVSLW